MKLNQAKQIAAGIKSLLEPHCQLIEIAGSIRRECALVNDIEIVCVPNAVKQSDLFDSSRIWVRSTDFSKTVRGLGAIIKGSPETGKYCRVVVSAVLELDLFMTTLEDYYRILAIRTGPADYSHKVLASGWTERGWCGSDMGLRRQKDCEIVHSESPGGKDRWKCINVHGDLPPVWQSEEEFFKWVGALYTHPSKRRV